MKRKHPRLYVSSNRNQSENRTTTEVNDVLEVDSDDDQLPDLIITNEEGDPGNVIDLTEGRPGKEMKATEQVIDLTKNEESANDKHPIFNV